jgi:Spy/CpxP family protein refolding chaperone
MKHHLLATAIILGITGGTAFADDPPQPPRTHVDTTVVGSNTAAESNLPSQAATSEAATLDNAHNFEAGAPDLLKITDKLHLSPKQKAQLHDAIERADAGAAVLIKREHDVAEMIAATTPENPKYAELINQQGTESDRWTENRERLHRDILDLLSPGQRARFEELQASR